MSAPPQVPVNSVPAAVVEGVRAAVLSTFGSILGAAPDVTPGAAAPPGCSGLIGLISFQGDVNWTFSLGLPLETAPALIERFAGFAIPFDSADMCDVVGELANVIAGDIVAQLDRRKVAARMSLPMVVRGSGVEVAPPGDAPSARFACRCDYGSFWYSLAVANRAGESPRMPGRDPQGS